MQTSTTSLTCISCRLSFKDPEEQKSHYKSDFHRFNLKRKVANLPPVDEQQFGKKVQNLRDQEKNSENSQSFFCEVCSKSYSSSNSYSDHLKSKKHLENSKSNPELKKKIQLLHQNQRNQLKMKSMPSKNKGKICSKKRNSLFKTFKNKLLKIKIIQIIKWMLMMKMKKEN